MGYCFSVYCRDRGEDMLLVGLGPSCIMGLVRSNLPTPSRFKTIDFLTEAFCRKDRPVSIGRPLQVLGGIIRSTI